MNGDFSEVAEDNLDMLKTAGFQWMADVFKSADNDREEIMRLNVRLGQLDEENSDLAAERDELQQEVQVLREQAEVDKDVKGAFNRLAVDNQRLRADLAVAQQATASAPYTYRGAV